MPLTSCILLCVCEVMQQGGYASRRLQDADGAAAGMSLHLLVPAWASIAHMKRIGVKQTFEKQDLMPGTPLKVRTFPGKKDKDGNTVPDSNGKSLKDIIQVCPRRLRRGACGVRICSRAVVLHAYKTSAILARTSNHTQDSLQLTDESTYCSICRKRKGCQMRK